MRATDRPPPDSSTFLVTVRRHGGRRVEPPDAVPIVLGTLGRDVRAVGEGAWLVRTRIREPYALSDVIRPFLSPGDHVVVRAR
jgi:hypothetical protein